jgi:two-component system phosphate regulon response regulator PhoB
VSESKVIITIDDESDITEMIGMMLQAEGFRVIEAHSVFEGMKALASEDPALILLDIMMAGVDGMQFCKTLRDNPATSEIPVVFVTALGGDSDRAAAVDAGAAGYLAKPFTTEQLVSTVKEVLGS